MRSHLKDGFFLFDKLILRSTRAYRAELYRRHQVLAWHLCFLVVGLIPWVIIIILVTNMILITFIILVTIILIWIFTLPGTITWMVSLETLETQNPWNLMPPIHARISLGQSHWIVSLEILEILEIWCLLYMLVSHLDSLIGWSHLKSLKSLKSDASIQFSSVSSRGPQI